MHPSALRLFCFCLSGLFGFSFTGCSRKQHGSLITIPVPPVRIGCGLGMQCFHRSNERDAYNAFAHCRPHTLLDGESVAPVDKLKQ
jgi:hypothetical protein